MERFQSTYIIPNNVVGEVIYHFGSENITRGVLRLGPSKNTTMFDVDHALVMTCAAETRTLGAS